MIHTPRLLLALRRMWHPVECTTAKRRQTGMRRPRCVRTDRRKSPGDRPLECRLASGDLRCGRAVSMTKAYCRYNASKKKQMSHRKHATLPYETTAWDLPALQCPGHRHSLGQKCVSFASNHQRAISLERALSRRREIITSDC